MIRIKIIKPTNKYKVGDTVYVSPNEAHGLIDSGAGSKTKDMTQADHQTKKGKNKWRPTTR